MRSIGIGLLGLGLHGSRYARHIVGGDVPGAHLAAVWRRDADAGRQQAETWGCRFETDPAAVVDAPDVDAVITAVPVGGHATIAALVADKKKPLLSEKPLGRSYEEAESIRDRFDSAGVPLTVAQTLRFDPLVEALTERIENRGGLTGFCLEQRIEPRNVGWEDDREAAGGGVLLQTAIHTVDALWTIARPKTFTVEHARFAHHVYQDLEDHALLTVALGDCATSKLDRVVGHVAASKIGGSRHMRFAFYTETVGYEADFIARTLTEVRGRERTVENVPEQYTVAKVAAAFVRSLNGEPNPVPGAEGVRAVKVVSDAYAVGQWTGRSNV